MAASGNGPAPGGRNTAARISMVSPGIGISHSWRRKGPSSRPCGPGVSWAAAVPAATTRAVIAQTSDGRTARLIGRRAQPIESGKPDSNMPDRLPDHVTSFAVTIQSELETVGQGQWILDLETGPRFGKIAHK